MTELIALALGLLQQIPMKQVAMLLVVFMLGGLGALHHPFWAILLYYMLAALRPQVLWHWALPFEWRWSLYAAILVFGSLAINLPRMVSGLRMNAMVKLLFAYGSWLLLSTISAFDPSMVAATGSDVAKILIMALVAGLVVDRLWQVRGIALMLLLTLGYVAWEVNSLYLLEGRLDIFHYGYGGLDNNGAGLLLAMALPFAYAFGTGARRRRYRLASWFLGLLILHAILMSYSRGAMLATAVGVAWVLLHHRARFQTIPIAVGLAVVLPLLAGPEIRHRFLSTAQYQTDRSAQSRFCSWQAAWDMAMERPLTGQGIQNANRYSQNYGADTFNRTIHNQYLQMAAESGLPSMGLFIAIVATGMANLHRCRRRCREQLDAVAADPDPDRRAEVVRTERLILAYQASLLIYAFGGLFLSLGLFELPWLILMVAGATPGALAIEIRRWRGETEGEPAVPRPAPASSPVPALGRL